MQRSKERQVKEWYDSLGRMFLLQFRFRLIAQQQMQEELEKTKPWMPLWLRWVFRLLTGGVTV